MRMHPLFGEETGEFIDFAGWATHCSKVTKVNIIDVKAPRIGHLNPSQILAEIKFSLKDLKNAVAKQEWLSLSSKQALYIVCLEKDPSKKSSTEFPSKYGIKMVRGCFTMRSEDIKETVSIVDAANEEYSIRVVLDPT